MLKLNFVNSFISTDVHFKNPVLISFKIGVIFNTTPAESKQSQLMLYWKWQWFWKKWGSCNCLLKITELYYDIYLWLMIIQILYTRHSELIGGFFIRKLFGKIKLFFVIIMISWYWKYVCHTKKIDASQENAGNHQCF